MRPLKKTLSARKLSRSKGRGVGTPINKAAPSKAGLPAELTPITSAQEPVLSPAAGGARLQRVKKIDWSSVDWRKPVRQIAKELGCSRQAVYLAQARRWGQA